jgi:hypothetical protein
MLLHLSDSLAGHRSSGSADRPRRCQDCSHLLPRLRESAILSFNALLRQDAGGPLPSRTVKHASWRAEALVEFADDPELIVALLPLVGTNSSAAGGKRASGRPCRRSGSSWRSCCPAWSGRPSSRSPGSRTSNAGSEWPGNATGGAGCVSTLSDLANPRCSIRTRAPAHAHLADRDAAGIQSSRLV